MEARAASSGHESNFAFAFQAADFDFDLLRVHNVAALPNRRYRLVRPMRSDSEITGNGVTFTKTSTRVSRQREFDAVRDGNFPRVANKVTSDWWLKINLMKSEIFKK